MTTTKGQTMSVGGTGTYLSKVLDNAYVFGFKGTACGAGVSSLAAIWAIEECPEKIEAVPKPVQVPVSARAQQCCVSRGAGASGVKGRCLGAESVKKEVSEG
jgi:hypothetical protein